MNPGRLTLEDSALLQTPSISEAQIFRIIGSYMGRILEPLNLKILAL